jgi:predicted peptidase
MRMPERFAAVAPICGGGDERGAAKLVGVPIWAWHGGADNIVPVERSRSMIEAIQKAGGKPEYTELKGVGHNSWGPAYESPDSVVPWMFEQHKKS